MCVGFAEILGERGDTNKVEMKVHITPWKGYYTEYATDGISKI